MKVRLRLVGMVLISPMCVGRIIIRLTTVGMTIAIQTYVCRMIDHPTCVWTVIVGWRYVGMVVVGRTGVCRTAVKRTSVRINTSERTGNPRYWCVHNLLHT
jgi:hypothetical protein